MKYAASLGVATRREGGRKQQALWRKIEDVRADCKVREAAEQQRSASPSQAAPVAPSIEVPTQAARAAGAGTEGLENSQLAHAGGARLCQPEPSGAGRSKPWSSDTGRAGGRRRHSGFGTYELYGFAQASGLPRNCNI